MRNHLKEITRGYSQPTRVRKGTHCHRRLSLTMSPDVDCFIWYLIFQNLELADLIQLSSVCFEWWKIIFGGRGALYRKFERCSELDLANTGSLYKKVPLRFFQSLRRLNLNGTAISTGDFGKVASVAKHVRVLNIESCLNINESAIFKAKGSLLRLVRIDISYNTHFSVRSIACLCSYRSLQEVCAKGIPLDHTDILFLAKTFPRLVNGDILLETDTTGDGDYFFDIVDIAADEDIFEEFF